MSNQWQTYFDGSRSFMPEEDVLKLSEEILSMQKFRRRKRRFWRRLSGYVENYELQSSRSGGYFLNFGVEFDHFGKERNTPLWMKNVHWAQRSSVFRSPGSMYFFFESEKDVEKLCAYIIQLSLLIENNLDGIRNGVERSHAFEVQESA